MFKLLRYGLIPVVLFCGVVVTASIDAYSSNLLHKSTWPQTVATVVRSQDFGDVLAKLQGTPNTFPDPHGALTYAVDGKTYTWEGRGRDIGATAMNPGDRIKIYYDPKNPEDISTLVLLGAGTGSIIAAAAFAFLAFYVWFFWLRGFVGRSGPRDSGGAGGDPLLEPLHEMIDLPTPSQQLRPAKAPARPSGRGRPAFGRR